MSSVRRPLIFRGIVVVLAAVIVGAALFARTWCTGSGVADLALIDDLARHRALYLQVVEMLSVDSVVQRVTEKSVSPANSISIERQAVYARLLAELRLADGVARSGGGLLFIRANRGLLTGGVRKGLAYRPDKPYSIFDSLDSPPPGLLSNTIAFRTIDSDWYIFLEFGN